VKFLLISSYKDSMTTLPPSVSRQMSEGLLGWIGQQRQAGRVLESYVIPAWKRAVIICDFESADQITQILPGMPGFGFMDFEVYPLADFEGAVKNMVEALKKAEQMMPQI
jgi:muconolactone delta-isomerase